VLKDPVGFSKDLVQEMEDLRFLVSPPVDSSAHSREHLARANGAVDVPHHVCALLRQFPTHGSELFRRAQLAAEKHDKYVDWCAEVKVMSDWMNDVVVADAADIFALLQKLASGSKFFHLAPADDLASYKVDFGESEMAFCEGQEQVCS
jgi:hypothetical protein